MTAVVKSYRVVCLYYYYFARVRRERARDTVRETVCKSAHATWSGGAKKHDYNISILL